MSQTIVVLVAVVMIVGGGYVLFSQVDTIFHPGTMNCCCILIILLGFYLLWDAFLR